MTEKLTECEQRILEILSKNPAATYVYIAEILHVSRKTVSQKLKLLKDKGLIIRVGSAKKGYWKKPE